MFDIRREDDLDFRSGEYADLYARSRATLFQHPLWLHHLYTSLAPARRAERLVVTAREPGSGRLLMVLPLLLRRGAGVRRVEFADLGVCDYVAPVLDVGEAERLLTSTQALDAVRQQVGRFDLLWVDKVVPPSELHALLSPQRAVPHPFATHRVELASSFEQWRTDRLDPSFVRHLDRKRKRLRPRGTLALEVVTAPEEVRRALQLMATFRAQRFSERRGVDLMQDPDCAAFYQQVAVDSAAAGGPGQTTVLTVGGEPVAASFGLVDADTHVFVLVGYDFGRLRNYSLGLLIVEELIRDAIGHGRRCFDLTLGDEGYKHDFGAVPSPMESLRRPGTVRGGLAQRAGDGHLAARRIAKAAVMRSPALEAGLTRAVRGPVAERVRAGLRAHRR